MFGWMDFTEYEKKKEKIGEKTFLVSVWLKEREEKKLVRPGIFFLD